MGQKKKKPKKIDILKCVGEIYGDEEGLTGMMGKWGMRVSMHCVHVQSHLRRNLMKNKVKYISAFLCLLQPYLL